MKYSQSQKEVILKAFQKMQSKEDFLNLLNKAKSMIYENATGFELKQLTFHANPKLNKKRYTSFSVKKKSGGIRTINAPNKGLKMIQESLNLILQMIYEPSANAYGFVPGKSIVDNAKVHAKNNYVYNIDLKDFFPSIDQARVWGRLQYPPFNLNEKSNRLEIANLISGLCCQTMEVERMDESGNWQKVERPVLPQGAPTSPTLTNIICQQLDFYLTAVAKRFGLNYSRYADDITFSSMHNVYQKDSAFLKEIERIITAQNFHIKETKTRLQKQGFRQEVTGLLVNENANVQKRYIKELRMWLYFWEQHGYAKAYSIFVSKYKADKGHVKKHEPNMVNVIAGKLEYLKMVKGKENQNYLKLNQRFEKLIKVENINFPFTRILDIWENDGIEKAMELYFSSNKAKA